MTCIVGLVGHDGCIYIGGDSAATNDSSQQTIRADPKIFRVGALLFGCTSSYRMIQLLHYSLVLPGYTEDGDILRYMAVDVVNAVRACLIEGGFATKDEGREKGGKFLVGFRGKLFCIESDYQVEEVLIGYNAAGSGDDIALGVMYATQQCDMLPEQRITLALEAAAYHNADVRRPFHVERIDHALAESA